MCYASSRRLSFRDLRAGTASRSRRPKTRRPRRSASLIVLSQAGCDTEDDRHFPTWTHSCWRGLRPDGNASPVEVCEETPEDAHGRSSTVFSGTEHNADERREWSFGVGVTLRLLRAHG